MRTKLTILGVVAIISLVVGSYIRTSGNWLSFNTNNHKDATANYYDVEEKVVEETEIKNEEESSNEEIPADTNDAIYEEEIIENVDSTEPILSDYKEIVYDGLTLDELSEKLNRSLNSDISGKGYLIASHALELGVDPYMATAIILQETGCKWQCSYLVRSCNNVGGQKGSGCGSYSYFNSLDEGIIAFIDNLYKNYISYGLYTPEQINPKYAEDPNWAVAVNRYIESIKAQ